MRSSTVRSAVSIPTAAAISTIYSSGASGTYFYAFDLPSMNGRDLRSRLLLERKRELLRMVLAAGVNSTLVAGENLTVGSTVWLPAESLAPGR